MTIYRHHFGSHIITQAFYLQFQTKIRFDPDCKNHTFIFCDNSYAQQDALSLKYRYKNK